MPMEQWNGYALYLAIHFPYFPWRNGLFSLLLAHGHSFLSFAMDMLPWIHGYANAGLAYSLRLSTSWICGMDLLLPAHELFFDSMDPKIMETSRS